MIKTIFLATTLTLLAGNATSSQRCPQGFTDTGAHCLKPTYTRGAGNRSMSHCEADFGAGNCEKCFSLYYPICGENFAPAGCNTCAGVCPPGMTDIGVSCQK